MSSTTTIERRQEILEYLSANRSGSRLYFAERYGVTEKTIRNDITELSLTAPIYTVQGNGGGIFVSDGWYISRKYFSPDEEQFLSELMECLDGEKKEKMRKIIKDYTKPKCNTEQK